MSPSRDHGQLRSDPDVARRMPPYSDVRARHAKRSATPSGVWLYVIAGGLAFAEAAILVGMVLPGEIALLVAGLFCKRSTAA